MNRAETTVAAKLWEENWQIITRGWPDFLCVKRDSSNSEKAQIIAVEVKSGRDWLSEDQSLIHTILRQAGIPCYVVKDEDAPNFSTQEITKRTIRFDGTSSKDTGGDALDERGVPYRNRIAELERKLAKANALIHSYESKESVCQIQ